MAMNGGFNNTLDEKGRVTFPARLKNGFSGDVLVITRGLEPCLYLFPLKAWKEFAARLENPQAASRDWRRLQRHFLGWAVEAEIDKSGRLAIPQSLRDYAGLTRDVIVMGVGRRVELWDAERYRAAQGKEDNLEDIAERYGFIF